MSFKIIKALSFLSFFGIFSATTSLAMQTSAKDMAALSSAYGKPEVHCAIYTRDLANFKKIIALPNFDPNQTDDEGETALMLVLQDTGRYTPDFIKEVFTSLLTLPRMNPNLKNRGGVTPLMSVLMYTHRKSLPNEFVYELFKALLALPKLDVTVEHDGYSAIDVVEMNLDYVRPLIERGAQPRILDTFERAKKTSKEVYEYLIKNSDVAVHYALYIKDKELFRSIIASPTFNPNKFYKKKETPLMWALHRAEDPTRWTQEYTFEVVTALLNVPGIDINACSVENYSALTVAMRSGLDYTMFLRERGAQIRVPVDYHFARKYGAPGVFDYVRKLEIKTRLASGADKKLAPPPGQYTIEEAMQGIETRKHMLEEKKKCGHCKKPNCTLRCSVCRQVYYCSVDHQRADWDQHKKNFHQPKECSVCFEGIPNGSQETCGHSVCKVCLDEWKKQSNLCPVCRAQLD